MFHVRWFDDFPTKVIAKLCRFGGKTPRCLLSCSVVATLWIPGCAIVRINLPMTDPWCCYIYGVPWIPSIYPLYVSIYTSTMDPMGYVAAYVGFRLLLGSIKSQTTEYHMVKWIPLSTWTFNIYIQFSSAETCTSLQQRQEIVSELLLLEATLCMARSHSGRLSQPKLPTNCTWQSWRYSNQPYGSEMKHPTHKILWSLNFKRLALMLLTLIYYWAWPIISWSHDPALHGIASLLHLDP